MTLLGIGIAAIAAALYNGGVAIQTLEARETESDHSLRPSLLAGLARRRLWLLGTLLVTLGWVFHAVALLFAPLTAAQPVLAVGLLLLLVVGAHVLHERVGPREIGATIAICAGLVVLSLTAPDHTPTKGSTVAVAVALGGLGAAALVPYVLSSLGRRPRVTIVLGAGLAYAWAGISTKLVADAVAGGEWVTAGLWVLATAAVAGVGLLSEMTALQITPATRVAPVVLVVDIVVAVAFAGALVGERWDVTPLGGAVLLGGVALMTGGAAVLASSSTVATAGHPEAVEPASAV